MNYLDKQLPTLDNHILVSNRKGDRSWIGKLGDISIQSSLMCRVLEEANEIIYCREDEGDDPIGLDKIEERGHLRPNLFFELFCIGLKYVMLSKQSEQVVDSCQRQLCYLYVRDAVVLLDHRASQRSMTGEPARELFLAHALLSLGEDGGAVYFAESHC